MKLPKKSRGFTIIELLVVIAIIGIFGGIVFASLSTARARGRDTKRIAAGKTLHDAIEIYKLNSNKLPDNTDDSPTSPPGDNAGGFDVGNIGLEQTPPDTFLQPLLDAGLIPKPIIESDSSFLPEASFAYFKYEDGTACNPGIYAILAIKLERKQTEYSVVDTVENCYATVEPTIAQPDDEWITYMFRE